MHRSLYLAKNDNQGFTLIELLVAVSLLSVLIMLASPSLQDFFVKNKMRRISDDFQQSIFKSKNTAVSKNICTTMCMSTTLDSSAPACATSEADWQVGWMIFLNHNCDSALNQPSSTADVIEIRKSAGIEYFLQSQSNTRKIVFNSRGQLPLGSADEFDLIYKSVGHGLTEKFGLNICLDNLGRTRNIPSSYECKNYK